MYCATPLAIIINAGSNSQNHQPCPMVLDSTIADDHKCNAHEDVFERLFEREFPATPRPAAFLNFRNRWLHELTRQSLRHEADIRSATATKTRAVEILGSALRTEHLFFAFQIECSLASRLVQQHACRNRDIQRFQFARDRYTHECIAVFSDQPVQAVSFASEKNCGRQSPIPIRVQLCCFSRGPNHPDVTFFQLLYQSREVRHSRHRNILERARGDFRDDARQTDRASLGNEDSVSARTLCGAQDRSHVARIFDSIKSEHQRRIVSSDLCFELIQQVVRVRITRRRDARHDALVSHVAK